MKRPLAVFGLIYLATSAAAVCFFPEVNFILCVMAAITAIAACFIYREKLRDVLTVFLPICLAFLVIGCCQWNASGLADQLSGQSCVISGEICDIPRRQYGRWRYIIETDSVDIPGANQNIRLLATSRTSLEEAKEGDRITCQVTFLQSSGETGYSSTTSLRADGISARAWCVPYTKYSVESGSFRLRYLPQKIKRAVISGIRKALPVHASAMLCGMLLGDTDYMDSRIVENFRSTGIAHLLAVSGLHLTLLTLALEEMLRRTKQPRRLSSVWIICFILLFMAVTGFPPSVVRAGAAHILTQLGKITYRDADSLTSMSVAILLMCLVNPWAAADIGLQLSVCATLGLLFLHKRIYTASVEGTKRLLDRFGKRPASKTVNRAGKLLLRSIAVSISAGVSILPLTVVHFGSVSLISPITNLLCVYAASVFIILGTVASLLYCVPIIGWLLSLPLRLAASVLCAYLETVTGGLAAQSFSTLNTDFGSATYLVCFILVLIVLAAVVRQSINRPAFSTRLRKYVLCQIAVLVFAAALSNELFCRGPEIIIFCSDNGDLCVCAKNRTHAVIAEAGGDRYDMQTIVRTLHAKGVTKVDAAAISDDSPARSGNAERLIKECSPDLLVTDIPLHTKTSAKTLPYINCVHIDSFGLRLDTFTDSSGLNWIRLTGGETTALICPDNGNCTLLPEEWRSVDAVVTSKEINGLSALRVGAVVIADKNNSAPITRERLKRAGYRHVYTTATDGSVTLYVKSGRLRVRTQN